MKITLTLILILSYSLISYSQDPKYYVCYKADNPVQIDGQLDEEEWGKAEWTDNFIDIEGEHKEKPKYETRVKMLWSDSCLYIAAELDEPHIWATLTERESVIFYDNDFEVFIDPNGDTQDYMEFEINAFGTEWDLLLTKPYRNGGSPMTGWSFNGIKTGVKMYGTINDPSDTDEKWTLEIALPFKDMLETYKAKVFPEAGDQWRINFSRVQWDHVINDGKYEKEKDPKTGHPKSEYNWVWSPQGKINMHMPEKWGYLQFSEHKVGTSKDSVVLEPDREVIDLLWELYKKQKHFFMANKKFNSHMEEVNVKVDAGNNYFELIYELTEKGYYWVINQDGWIRKIKILRH